MDDFIEYLVKKQATTKMLVEKTLIILASIVLAIVCFMFCISSNQIISFVGALLAVGAIYGGWYLSRSFKLEFEYIVTGTDMDVDKIIAQSRRKRVISLSLRNIEIMAPAKESYRREIETPSIKTRIDASTGNPDDTYFAKFDGGAEKGLTLLLFSPDNRIIQCAKKAAPRKVFTE